MKALLLCAGIGSRLRPLTDTIPKCLVPIDGKPLLSYWLELLRDADLEAVLINLHYKSEMFVEYLHESDYGSFAKTVYEPSLLGTGGTLLKNRGFFGHSSMMLVHADNLSRFDVRDFIHAHQKRPKGSEITMMTFRTDAPQTCGILELDSNGVVRALHEKVKNPPGNLANAAVYILEPTVVDFLASLGKPVIDISTEVLPHYMGKIFAWENRVYHRDIGTPESLAIAQQEFSERYG